LPWRLGHPARRGVEPGRLPGRRLPFEHAQGWRMKLTSPISRRAFLRRAIAAGAGSSLGGVGGYAYARYVEPWWHEVVRHDVPLPGLPDAFAGLKIAQISDLHLGRYATADDLEPAVRATQGLGADVIV